MDACKPVSCTTNPWPDQLQLQPISSGHHSCVVAWAAGLINPTQCLLASGHTECVGQLHSAALPAWVLREPTQPCASVTSAPRSLHSLCCSARILHCPPGSWKAQHNPCPVDACSTYALDTSCCLLVPAWLIRVASVRLIVCQGHCVKRFASVRIIMDASKTLTLQLRHAALR
jgi:hypothetical protein